MPLILPARTLDTGGYEIDNSLRFNDDDSAYLGRTPSSASNRRTWTWSGWVKISTGTAHDHTFFSGGIGLGASGNRTVFRILSGELEKVMVFSGNTSEFALKTSASLRDRSAWYHFVLAMDTTQSTDSNRFKMYINGSQVTDTAQLTYPSQNLELGVNTNEQHYIGFLTATNELPFDGYMADINFADGTQYAASDFGEYNDNGVWIPKEPNITYGTNGYRLEFKNSGALGTDTSGNGNNFTPTNLTANDVCTDSPTNNFATFNSVDTSSNITLSEGNTLATANSNHSASRATIGLKNGKWYWENKIVSVSGGPAVGVMAANAPLADQLNANPSRFYRNNGQKYSNGSASSYGNSYTTNDIIGVALDLDNGNIYFYKNGTIQNSGTAAFTDLLTATSEHWLPAVKLYNEAISINFGNPSHSISSGNTDGLYGDFEYAPPSGYYALCTKRLAEYG